MKKLYTTIIVCLIAGCTTLYAQQGNIPNAYDLPQSGSVIADDVIIPENDADALVDMPTVDFPEEAKILVWWPETMYNYNMPNMLGPLQPELVDGLKINPDKLGDEE